MAITFVCACNKQYSLPEDMIGKRVRCKACNAIQTVVISDLEGLSGFAHPSEQLEIAAAPPTERSALLPTLSMAQLRDDNETTAWTLLLLLSIPACLLLLLWIVVSMGIVLIIIGMIALIGLLSRLFLGASIKSNAVRISPTQYPELNRIVDRCAERLQIERPDVYVLQQNVWNALAMKLAGRRMVVLLSGAVDSILLKGDMDEMAFVVGHEIGHHAAGHLSFWHQLPVRMGSWLPWLYLWYSRRCELTCDRVGLYCAGSLQPALLAVCNMSVGAQMARTTNIAEAIEQWRQHSGELFVRYRTLYSTHPPNLARLQHLANAANTLGIPA